MSQNYNGTLQELGTDPAGSEATTTLGLPGSVAGTGTAGKADFRVHVK